MSESQIFAKGQFIVNIDHIPFVTKNEYELNESVLVEIDDWAILRFYCYGESYNCALVFHIEDSKSIPPEYLYKYSNEERKNQNPSMIKTGRIDNQFFISRNGVNKYSFNMIEIEIENTVHEKDKTDVLICRYYSNL